MIGIIDYGMGNLRSVQKALENVGADARIINTPETIASSQKLVLPGVGAIRPAMEKLKSLKLIEAMLDSIKDNKPFLGICLGFQLLFEKSDEGGDVTALGIAKGTVEKFDFSDQKELPTKLKIPHMGWNQLQFQKTDCPLLKGLSENINVYFCHSYYVKTTDSSITAATTDYGTPFTSMIQKDNIFGTQFHPEKSQSVGLLILENFVNLP